MKLNCSLVILFALLLVISCKEPIARRPISHHSESFMKESVDRNKHIKILQEKAIRYYISRDSTNNYLTSPDGYWCTYITKQAVENVTAKVGDTVFFEYEISNFSDEIIYSKEYLGIKSYVIDKEDIESGLQNGLKMMKEGEEVIFLFPSFKAFGIVGDKAQIGTNQPLIYKVKLNKIK